MSPSSVMWASMVIYCTVNDIGGGW